MSELDRQVPPQGEEIHLPGPSLKPFMLAVGLTMGVVGITTYIALVVLGAVVTLWSIISWIVDTRRDMDALPAEHHSPH
jgi:hypothetical protein